MTETADGAELDRRFNVAGLDVAEITPLRIEASADECAAIARRLDILAVKTLVAALTAVREDSGDISVYGSVSADVEQACVVSLEPVAEQVKVDISQRFTVRADEEEGEDEDPFEPIVDDEIDIGEVIVQNLALALDPYPRAAGAVFEPVDDDEGVPSGPFAALAQLRDGDGKKE